MKEKLEVTQRAQCSTKLPTFTSEEEGVEVSVVSYSHTVVDPWAVMVEGVDAGIADGAV